MTTPERHHVIGGLFALGQNPRQSLDHAERSVSGHVAPYSAIPAFTDELDPLAGNADIGDIINNECRREYTISQNATSAWVKLNLRAFPRELQVESCVNFKVIPSLFRGLQRFYLQGLRPSVESSRVPQSACSLRSQACGLLQLFSPVERNPLRHLHHIAHFASPFDLNSDSIVRSSRPVS